MRLVLAVAWVVVSLAGCSTTRPELGIRGDATHEEFCAIYAPLAPLEVGDFANTHDAAVMAVLAMRAAGTPPDISPEARLGFERLVRDRVGWFDTRNPEEAMWRFVKRRGQASAEAALTFFAYVDETCHPVTGEDSPSDARREDFCAAFSAYWKPQGRPQPEAVEALRRIGTPPEMDVTGRAGFIFVVDHDETLARYNVVGSHFTTDFPPGKLAKVYGKERAGELVALDAYVNANC